MMKKSKWVETEIEVGGEVFLIPLRCRMEAKNGRFRTRIQIRDLQTNKWHARHTSDWMRLPAITKVTRDYLDTLAEGMADKLIHDTVAHNMLHPDWRVQDLGPVTINPKGE